MANVIGTDNPETINAADGVTGGADTILAFNGADTVFGLGGNDEIKGGGGADEINGGGGTDTATYRDSGAGVVIGLAGGLGDGGTAEGDRLLGIENLIGSQHDDVLAGNQGKNVLSGLQGNDLLKGGGGSDVLKGLLGNDTLEGGAGADTLRGGAGADYFLYTTTGQSTPASRDVIGDFSRFQGDRIDLSAIDANPYQDFNQAFSFIGGAAFSGAGGELRVFENATDTFVAADTDADGLGDLQIMVAGLINLNAGDFVL